MTTMRRKLILINGVYGVPEHFDTLREALAPDVDTEVFGFRREGAPDPVGPGGFATMVSRLEEAIERATVQGEAPAVLGFSLGATLALEHALAHPGRAQALILINPLGRFGLEPLQASTLPALWTWQGRWTNPAITARVVHRVAWVKRSLFHADAPLETIERGVRAASRLSHADVTYQLAHLSLPAPRDYRGSLREVPRRARLMIAASRDDQVVPPRHSAWLAAAMPEATALPPFEGGHAFFQHDARALARVVREFLGADAGPGANGT